MAYFRMDRGVFFASVRRSLFKGSLTQSQVDGLNLLLDEFERRFDNPTSNSLKAFGYLLGTTFHETARTMQPIAEWGKGKGRPYGRPHPVSGKVYYGRGFVQLTWYDNYVRMAKLLGIPALVENPDLAMDPDIAVQIIFEGMYRGVSTRGDFTGKALEDYFEGTVTESDWLNARRIVNGMDRASTIAKYGKAFYVALSDAYAAGELVDDEPKPGPHIIQDPESGDTIVKVDPDSQDYVEVNKPNDISVTSWALIVKAIVDIFTYLFRSTK